jgi:protoheme IX farnesyltransferase
VTARWILAYTLGLLGVSLAFAAVAHMGLVYTGAAVGLGGVFVLLAVRMYLHPTAQAAMRLFGYSITYLTLLFAAIAVDQLIGGR